MNGRMISGFVLLAADVGLAVFLAHLKVEFGWPIVSLLLTLACIGGLLIDPAEVRAVIASLNPFGKRDP